MFARENFIAGLGAIVGAILTVWVITKLNLDEERQNDVREAYV